MNLETLSTLPLLASLLLGCAAHQGDDDRGKPVDAAPPAFADPATLPEPLLMLAADPARIGAVPTVVAVDTFADSGLEIAYTEAGQRERVDPRLLAAQWRHVRECVGIDAPAPLIVVVGDAIEPLKRTDDVIRDIDGRIVASSSATAGGVATLQVLEADLDGSLGETGFALRSIIGRHLWLSAMLPERDYPFRCARTAGHA